MQEASQVDVGTSTHDCRGECAMVEYRGYGRSEGEPSEEGIYRDAEAVWQWL